MNDRRDELIEEAIQCEQSARTRTKYGDDFGADQLRATAKRLREEAAKLPQLST